MKKVIGTIGLALLLISCGSEEREDKVYGPSTGIFDGVATNTLETCGNVDEEPRDFVIVIEATDTGYTLAARDDEQDYEQVMAFSENGYTFFGGRGASFYGCFVNATWIWEIDYTAEGLVGYRTNVFNMMCDPWECRDEWDIEAVER